MVTSWWFVTISNRARHYGQQ
jgi:hypothetical protein